MPLGYSKLPHSVKGGCVASLGSWTSWLVLNAEKKIGPFPGSSIRPNLVLIRPWVRWRRGVKWECGRWKWRFSFLSFTIFRTFYIHGHTTAFTRYDCPWPWPYFKVIRLSHIKFLINDVWYGKTYYRQLIGNHKLAFDWCHVWWPWSTFEGHFHVHFSNLWQAFASRGP